MKINKERFSKLLDSAKTVIVGGLKFERDAEGFKCFNRVFDKDALLLEIKLTANYVNVICDDSEVFFWNDNETYEVSALTKEGDKVRASFSRKLNNGYIKKNNIRSGYMNAEMFSEFIRSNYIDWIVL